MDSWHKLYSEKLVNLIVDEFLVLYENYNKDEDKIYALALITDDDALTNYIMISTERTRNSAHAGVEWEPHSWIQGLSDDDTFGVRAFTPIIMEHYENDIAPKFQKGFDYDVEFKENLDLYVYALKEAKNKLIKKWIKVLKKLFSLYLS
ncbi:hypothetical protein [Acinetobacter pittii]|uniref:hypothetical protein n=1 Tax=Acinetobacter pittii TaxID=48296 RepID=UPI0021CDF8AA|nr:hypothetical protein [Acinetobacter pittii]